MVCAQKGDAGRMELSPRIRAALIAASALMAAGPALAVTVDAGLQARLGIATQPLTAERRAAQIDAFAKVLDPGPLAQLDSDLRAAEAAASASRAEAKRSRALNASGGSIASKDVEAADAQARSDEVHLELLRRRVGLEWGPGIARLSVSRREALIQALSRGDAALVHIDSPSNEGQAGARSVDIDVGSSSVRGEVLGPARAAEPRLQSSGLIAVVRGREAVLLSNGLIQSAHIDSTSAVSGVIIPRSAVIRFEGSNWAYVRQGPSEFERRRLDSPAPEDKGLFVTAGFRAGDQVVVSGAIALFGVEEARRTQ
jgi:hypothetical protein